jgi:hypothetical protein
VVRFTRTTGASFPATGIGPGIARLLVGDEAPAVGRTAANNFSLARR